jgi:hypothetical protein
MSCLAFLFLSALKDTSRSSSARFGTESLFEMGLFRCSSSSLKGSDELFMGLWASWSLSLAI